MDCHQQRWVKKTKPVWIIAQSAPRSNPASLLHGSVGPHQHCPEQLGLQRGVNHWCCWSRWDFCHWVRWSLYFIMSPSSWSCFVLIIQQRRVCSARPHGCVFCSFSLLAPITHVYQCLVLLPSTHKRLSLPLPWLPGAVPSAAITTSLIFCPFLLI